MEPGTFNGLDSLESLDLGLNYITTLDPGAFEGLGSLTELQIGGNIITVLQTGVFIGLTSLEVLSLDFNQVEMFQTKAFQGLRSLSLLSLIDCGDLETLQWNAFDPLNVYTRGIFDMLTNIFHRIYEVILDLIFEKTDLLFLHQKLLTFADYILQEKHSGPKGVYNGCL